MTAKHSASRIDAPAAVGASDLPNFSQLNSVAGGTVALGELYRPMLDWWPAVDAVNGPLTADAGITGTAPSFSGLTYYGWASGKFNSQSQNWVTVPSSNGPTTNQCCQNTTTNRTSNYASTGLGFPCHLDFSFVSDCATLIIAYWQTTTFCADLGTSSSYHEVQIFADLSGVMKGIREFPAIWPNGSGGNQMYYRVITFSEAKRREFRVMMSAGCWLAGVYVDTGSLMTPAPNRPVLVGCFGDSWAEGCGNIFSSIGGNGSAAGVTWPSNCSMLYSNTAIEWAVATGFAVIIGHEGGTGYFNSNSGISATDTTDLGFSPFASANEVNFFWSTFSARNPMAGVFGGWNDGAGYTTSAYQAQATAAYMRLLAKNPTIPILVQGVQSHTASQGNGYDLANTGLRQAVAALKAEGYNMIGFINDMADANYQDVSAYNNLGPDGLHPTVKGGNLIGTNRAKRSAAFQLPRTFVEATLALSP